MRRFSALLLAAALALTPVHAQNLPDLGDVASSDLSALEERRIGESIMRDIRWHDPSYLNDVEVEDYVARIGRRLVAVSDDADREFEFFVLKDPSINAFALPGGYIGIHTGLLLTAETESEFASVMGHEIAHVTQRHIAQLYGKQGQSLMMVLGSLLVGALAAQSNPELAEAAIVAGQAGALQSQLGYSRTFEREADRIGLQLLERAGFDPRGMPGFFTRLQRATRVYESDAPGYLRTHPLTQDRFTDMEGRVVQMRYRQVLDSPDFGFVRAKLRAGQGLAPDAVTEFESRVSTRDDEASRYGLARALFRAGQLDEAERVLDELGERSQRASWVILLRAEIALARRAPQAALDILAPALERFRDSRALRYAYIDATLAAGRADEAASHARDAIGRQRADPRLWERLARAEERLGRRTAYHRAQAEVYALRGSLPAAIHQLELARSADDGDFYELSAVDARMRELKAEDRLRSEERR
ncbi:beta-barrel assembly-enhancing protease [Pseudazoarcus pumilus]|uniref:Peptidase M48 n=1 Tax=Pseudazoarcus pumilus TaxID=2067960 RepID=A0A2I6S595_9RHOO|nr:M48 family metalloprotease [Pseudazoarcus pumilus]AUN94421.1 peptidase M48 [Pseudazoarcus pumilus]